MAAYLRITVLFMAATLAQGLSITTFTLYTKPQGMNWATAVTFCREQGQELLRVMSQAEQDFLQSLGQQNGQWYNQNNGFYWSALHDPDPESTPGSGYQWQLLDPSSCLAHHGAESWSDWTQNEPLDPLNKACIKMEWSQTVGYRWRSEQCGTTIPKVICRGSGGSCNSVSQGTDKVITSSQRTLRIFNVTSSACHQMCSVTSAFQLDCWGWSWTLSSEECRLYLSEHPFTSGDTGSAGDGETELYIMQCGFASYLNVSDVPIPSTVTYEPQCSESGGSSASGNSNTSTTATVTPTAERQKFLMTYFPHTVTQSLAESTCNSLGSLSTMVTVKDSWTSRGVSQFLSSVGTQIKVWLGVRRYNATSGLTWLDGSDATWPEGNTSQSSMVNCVTGTATDHGQLEWTLANCSSETATFMCQTLAGSPCTYEKHTNKTMPSDWVLQSIPTANNCISYCNTHLYNNQECLAFTHDLLQSNCYFAYENGNLFDTDHADFYDRTCFEYAVYDNSSEAANNILYATPSLITETTVLANSMTSGYTSPLGSTATQTTETKVTTQQGATTDAYLNIFSVSANNLANGTVTELTSSPEVSTHVQSAASTSVTDVTSAPEVITQVTEAAKITVSETPSLSETTQQVSSTTVAMTKPPQIHKTTLETDSSTTGNTEAASQPPATTAATTITVQSKVGETTANIFTRATSDGVSATQQPATTFSRLLCQCAHCVSQTRLSFNTSDHEEIVAQMVVSLTINRKTTSLNRRKYECATDSRRSSQTIGSCGVAVLVVVFSVIFIMDLCGACCKRSTAERLSVRSKQK